MKIQKIELKNFKALKGEHSFDFKGCSVFLLGANGTGKSSIGRVAIDILTKDLPTQPITTGEKEGYVQITMNNGDKIYYKFSNDGKNKLEIITSDGNKYKNISDIFKQLSGDGMKFNINDFLNMAPKPRRLMLEKIVGVDFEEINIKEKLVSENYRELNSSLKSQEARITVFDKKLLTTEKIDTASLTDQLLKNIEYNNSVNRIINKKRESLDQIFELRKSLEECIKYLESTNHYLDENELIEDSVNDGIKLKIAHADETNGAIDSAINAHNELVKCNDLQLMFNSCKKELADVRKQKDELIRNCKMPAEGLEFSELDNETLLIDELPFENSQIATSRKMIAAIQIAQSMLGELKFLHLDASQLDKDNAMALLDWAEKNGLQLAIERAVWDGGELKFEIHTPGDGDV